MQRPTKAAARKRKILIIEDELILVKMYREKFEQEGFQVITASDVQEGLALAQNEAPDLIVLDILLPRGNGLLFLEELRENPAIARIPVVVFSNFDNPETIKRAQSLGAKTYLIKTDHTPKQIVQKIAIYLKESK